MPTLLSQTSLAVAIVASTVGTYAALSPPNPNTKPAPATGDVLRRLNVANQRPANIIVSSLGLLALQTSSLALLHPHIPASLLRHGAVNSLNPALVTWSPATSIPLALILCVGVPLRLVSYASLGKNFTFALAEPDGLNTSGMYAYVQHPSYTGILVLTASNAALLGRTDGALSCWIPPRWYGALSALGWAVLVPAGLALSVFFVWTRVRQEERMLRDRFGEEWESWHARTARFIPWIF